MQTPPARASNVSADEGITKFPLHGDKRYADAQPPILYNITAT